MVKQYGFILNKNKNLPYFLIVVALFFIVIAPSLLSDGMFKDGVLYAVVSKNLANNIGDFWHLSCTKTMLANFHEHPPLAFGIQSIFYKIFGESILIERFYSIFTFIITGIIVVKIWKLVANKKYISYSWLPLFLMISIPKITWAASNNLLENTLQIFTSLSVFFIVKNRLNNHYKWLILSGLMIFLGFLTKGPVALFPISFVFWIFLFEKKKSTNKMILSLFSLIIAIITLLLIMFIIFPESLQSISMYFNNQVIESIKNGHTVTTRFSVVIGFLKGLIPIGFIILFLMLSTRNVDKDKRDLNWFFEFLLLSLSGVFPIMITLKQRGFYILPALPFISIAFAIYIVPEVSFLIEKLNKNIKKYKIVKSLSYFIFILSIVLVFSQIGKAGRDINKITDIYKIIEIVRKDSVISIDPKLRTDWGLHGYFYRYANISLDDSNLNHKFLLTTKKTNSQLIKNYEKIPINLKSYNIFKKRKNKKAEITLSKIP